MLLTARLGMPQETDDGVPDLLAPLKQGHLVVWVLRPTPAQRDRSTEIPAYRGSKAGYTEQTAGSLGQTAGSFGQTAGSYGVASSSTTISVPNGVVNSGTPTSQDHPEAVGYTEQTSGSFGQTAGSYGTTASDHGQTPSTLGQTAGSYGATASDHGQTAGDFGHSLSTIAAAGSTDAKSAADAARAAARHGPQVPDEFRDRLQRELKARFGDLQASFYTIQADQLLNRLAELKGTQDYPDVVVAPSLPVEWQKVAGDLGVIPVGTPMAIEQAEAIGAPPYKPPVQASVMLRAPHPDTARAYVLWLEEWAAGGWGDGWEAGDGPANVAAGAVAAVLNGTSVDGDPDAAKFSAGIARRLALNANLSDTSGLSFRVEVLREAENDQLAVVALRTFVLSDRALGVLHSLVVMRWDGNSQWKVLQISENLEPYRLQEAFAKLQPFAVSAKPVQLGDISLTAPSDGDNRPPMPELGWDNGGGGGLLLVEWQLKAGAEWTDSRIYFVTEGTARSETRMTARFAQTAGLYRWRAWSLGSGGAVKLSTWRTMNIVR